MAENGGTGRRQIVLGHNRIFLLGAVLALACAACSVGPDPNAQQRIDAMRKIPALQWLEANRNPYPLASNRFPTAAEARVFVEELFHLGAVEVYVADPKDDEARVRAEGGPYADTLVVHLPDEAEPRRALFRRSAEEAARDGYAAEADVGQRQLVLWWD
jgi:hypothetical protein